MKIRLLLPVVLMLVAASVFAQNQYEVIADKNGGKIFKGIISREIVQGDTSFKWYAENLAGYTPQANTVSALLKQKDSIQLLVFMGTWCSDSHVIIPKLFAITDAAGFSKDRITLIGVDRQKKTLSNLSDALNIKNVPTIMVMKDGKEIGRVVEYGKYGMWDKEVGDIINTLK